MVILVLPYDFEGYNWKFEGRVVLNGNSSMYGVLLDGTVVDKTTRYKVVWSS